MRRLRGVLLSGVLVAVDNQPASANAISLNFPSDDYAFTDNGLQFIATVKGISPAVSDGTKNADTHMTIQAVENGAIKLRVIADIVPACS